jgi:predicted Zn-dependent peptidase
MERTELANGVHVLSEHIPGVRSAAVGVWVRQGGVHEAPAELGASHLLEHMVFKGTARRSAHDIALALESLGGSLDAYTSREHTSFQARVLDAHLPEALDVLADLTLAPTLSDDDLRLEREVVLEEIAQVEDTPDDLVFELHGLGMWDGHGYGQPILGTQETVSEMSGETLRRLHATRYCGQNLVVAAAGNVDHEDFVARVRGYFADLPAGERTPDAPAAPPTPGGDARVERPTAQAHVVFGTAVPGHASPDRYALYLLSSALGGGMSSRLFQKVREELGLCYSVFSFQSFYRQAGLLGVYVGTRPATEGAAVEAIREEMARMAGEGLPAEEFERTKRQMKGQVMLGLESTVSRLHRLASAALYDEPFLGLDGLLERIEAITEDDVRRVSERYLNPDAHYLLRLGPNGP